MSDLNERLAQEAAELINGGEWRDGKWYSEGHRDAWRRALKPAADRIEQLEAALNNCVNVLVCFERPDFYQIERTSPIKPYALGALDVARAALEEKKHD